MLEVVYDVYCACVNWTPTMMKLDVATGMAVNAKTTCDAFLTFINLREVYFLGDS